MRSKVPFTSARCCGLSHKSCCDQIAFSCCRKVSGKFRAKAKIKPMVCSAMGTEKIPLALVTITPELRNSGYMSWPTPAEVECTHFNFLEAASCAGRNTLPTKNIRVGQFRGQALDVGDEYHFHWWP